jgi:hypothetical protein
MKKNLLIITAMVITVLSACNQTEKKEETTVVTTDTVKTTETTVTTSTPVYDADPTDTIPGDRYGINSSDATTAELIRLSLRNLFKKDLDKNLIDSANRKFIFFEYDLNEDGKKEKFVGLTGSYFCGTGGCTQFLLNYQGNVITKFTVSDYPIVIDHNKTNGWKDLFIRSGSKDRIVKFDGKTYPSNPSTLPALTVLPGDGLPRALDFTNEPYPWFKF